MFAFASSAKLAASSLASEIGSFAVLTTSAVVL